MAGKADFTTDEWTTMQRAMVGAPLFVAVSDGNQYDLVKELALVREHLQEAREGHGSQLVQELADLGGAQTGFYARMNRAQVEGPALDALRAARVTLQAKAPDELDSFKYFVVELCKATAAAARSHLFGYAGPKISENEAVAVDKVRAALGLI
jgi:hypothetical protein